MDFKSAITLEGYLEKQSPNIISIFQKRYFTFRFKGQFLVWFKKKPSAVTDEPKGFIKVLDIKDIVVLENENQLQIKYHQRIFLLRAENKIVRDRWVASLESVRLYLQKMSNNIESKNQIDRLDRNQAWRWDKARDEQIKLIRLQNQLIILNEGEDSIQENSSMFLTQLINGELSHSEEKNIVYGFFNRKGTIRSETRWYFICSQYNLYDEGDENAFQITSLMNRIQTKINQSNTIHNKSSSSDSQQENNKKDESKYIKININTIYEFDIKTKKLLQTLPLNQVVSIVHNISQVPFNMYLKYLIFNKGEQQEKLYFKEQQKEIKLLTNYQTEINKWSQAINIIMKKYNIIDEREKILEQRFVRYKIKMFRTQKEQDWRIIGTQSKPQYIYLNRQYIKVGGLTFLLEKITGSLKHEKITVDEQQDNKVIGCNIPIEDQILTVVFQASQDERDFRKKAKILFKRLEPYLAEKKQKEIKINSVKQDLSTYFLDKKMRQSSANIKVNFYSMMQQENSIPYKPQSPPKEKSFFDKFLSILCSVPPQDVSENLRL